MRLTPHKIPRRITIMLFSLNASLHSYVNKEEEEEEEEARLGEPPNIS
jgi:hypothetical protein